MAIFTQLLAIATAEWNRFGDDVGEEERFIRPDGSTTTSKGPTASPFRRKETVEPYNSRIADYWLAISSAEYAKHVASHAKAKGRLDGTVALPWSAAFVSYCMQMAGAGKAFPFSGSHVAWIARSIANRSKGKTTAPLVGYEPAEVELRLGDLVGRTNHPGVTYATAAEFGWFRSHTDIVVEIDRTARIARMIGGNVGHSVSRFDVAITAEGRLANPASWLVHIQNNI